MDDSNYFVRAFAVFASAAIIVLAAWIYFHRSENVEYRPTASSSYAAPARPQTSAHTIAFMPGQYLDIPNRRFRKVEIHSTFPVRIVSGSCQQNYGVEFYCNSNPTDIFITDMRQPPLFSTPQANIVTVTAQEF